MLWYMFQRNLERKRLAHIHFSNDGHFELFVRSRSYPTLQVKRFLPAVNEWVMRNGAMGRRSQDIGNTLGPSAQGMTKANRQGSGQDGQSGGKPHARLKRI